MRFFELSYDGRRLVPSHVIAQLFENLLRIGSRLQIFHQRLHISYNLEVLGQRGPVHRDCLKSTASSRLGLVLAQWISRMILRLAPFWQGESTSPQPVRVKMEVQ